VNKLFTLFLPNADYIQGSFYFAASSISTGGAILPLAKLDWMN